MAAHAKLSPSGSHTWMNCPGSIPLTERLDLKGGESIYASMGTAMHEVSERALKSNGRLTPSSFIGAEIYGHTITQDMIDICDVFVNFVNEIPGFAAYEQRVHVPVIENCWGTADVVKIHDGHLNVIDLKTGQGVAVDAHENTQGLCYAYGAFAAFDPVFDIEKITFTIVQPPLNSISSFTFGVDRLEEFEVELKEAEERINKARPVVYEMDIDSHDPAPGWEKIFVPSEKACKFCAAKIFCPAQRALAQKAARSDFGSFKKSEFGYWMSHIPLLKDFINAVEERVFKDLSAGREVEGFKLVEGKRSRKWKDEDLLLEELTLLYDDRPYMYLTPPKLMSPAQLEKSLKDEPFDLRQHIEREDGKPVVAPEADPREPINPNDSARKDFSGA